MMLATKNWFSAQSPHARFLCVIFLVVALNVFVRLHFLPLTDSTDARSYMDSARLISGEEAEKEYPGRLLKPLAPLGIALFAQIFNDDMVFGFLALNVLCYLLLGVAMYALLALFTTDRFLAMLGTLVFISTYPVLEYGLNLYSEMGAWALLVFALYGAVRYYRDATWKNFFIATSAVVVGLLWKEYSVIGGIFFGLTILFVSTQDWKEKFLRIVLLGALSVLAMGTVAWIVYAQFHYTYMDWLRDAATVHPSQSQYTPYFIGKSLFGVYLLGWGLVLAGLSHWRALPRPDQWTLVLLLPPSLMFFLWTFVSSRLYYVIAPLLAILALHGLRSLSGRRAIQVALVALVMVGSYGWLFVSDIVRASLQ